MARKKAQEQESTSKKEEFKADMNFQQNTVQDGGTFGVAPQTTKEHKSIELSPTESMALIYVTDQQQKINEELMDIQKRYNEFQTKLIEVTKEIFEKSGFDISKAENVQFSDDKKHITFTLKS